MRVLAREKSGRVPLAQVDRVPAGPRERGSLARHLQGGVQPAPLVQGGGEDAGETPVRGHGDGMGRVRDRHHRALLRRLRGEIRRSLRPAQALRRGRGRQAGEEGAEEAGDQGEVRGDGVPRARRVLPQEGQGAQDEAGAHDGDHPGAGQEGRHG